MNHTNPKVDAYLTRAKHWPEELAKFRSILLDCGLTEEFKWGKPCYAHENGNVVILLPLKEHCALLFFKGVLLDDPNDILVQAGENSEVGRQMRFTSLGQIVEREGVIRSYVYRAIDVEKSGQKVTTKKRDELELPEELEKKFEASPAFKTAFEALTPGRQRGYIFHFSAPKQGKTREARIEKCVAGILEGKGLNDR